MSEAFYGSESIWNTSSATRMKSFHCLKYKQEKTGSSRSFFYYKWRKNDVTALSKEITVMSVEKNTSVCEQKACCRKRSKAVDFYESEHDPRSWLLT